MHHKYVIFLGIIAISLSILGIVIWRSHSTKKSPESRPAQISVDSHDISYLPLGDSYTIGQSVAMDERWPNQLVADYQPHGKHLKILTNPSVTGYTTQNLIDQELPLVRRLHPQFVTVLIGVNDYVQGVSADTFRVHLHTIVSEIQRELSNPDNILLVTIPDYSKTPTGALFGNPATATLGIQQFNKIIKQTAATYHIPVADIFSISQQVASDSSLIANDGLHPSGKEYTAWVSIIKNVLIANNIPN